MAIFDLNDQFKAMQSNIELGDRTLVAIAAHFEVRSVLRASDDLQAHGLNDVLVGSYARRVAIWPGKDVDVFGQLDEETVQSITSDDAYQLFEDALRFFDDQGRLTRQPRSLKVSFGPSQTPSPDYVRAAAAEYEWEQSRVSRVIASLADLDFEFSVDVVPAVRWGAHYGISEVTSTDQGSGVRQRTGGWLLTDPVGLIEETRKRNRDLTIGGRGAFVPTVKALKQIKSVHLSGAKPSFLFHEFALHEGFAEQHIQGDSWADVTASALAFLAGRIADVSARPVCDPILDQPYEPAPSPSEAAEAQSILSKLARRAERAVDVNSRCQAAIEWRHVFGGNAKLKDVFPLPPGCRDTGGAMGVAAGANLATGGSPERSFGGS